MREEKLHWAASLIQSHWRGYTHRRDWPKHRKQLQGEKQAYLAAYPVQRYNQ